MSDSRQRLIAPMGLVVGAVLGIAGTFAPSAARRGLAWGFDGTALIVAGALLTIHYFRRGNDVAAAGFLVFVVGEGLISLVLPWTSWPAPLRSRPALGCGPLHWPSSARPMPCLRGTGFIGSLLFTVVAVQIFLGRALTPLSQRLPFFAYPFLAATLCGWAWVHYHDAA
jgi:hypothetical protein